MSNDSGLFRTREQLEADGWRLGGNVFRKEEDGRLREHLPLYEAKMVHQFDHRWATYDGEKTRDLTLAEKQDPNRVTCPATGSMRGRCTCAPPTCRRGWWTRCARATSSSERTTLPSWRSLRCPRATGTALRQTSTNT